MVWTSLFPTRRQRTARRGARRPAAARPACLESLEQRLLLAADTPVRLTPIVTTLASPVVATHAGDGTQRMFVAEQGGAIRLVRNGVLAATPFLDLGASGLNQLATGGERGLLGLAFHPDYATASAEGEGKFYVYYSSPATSGGDHDSVLSEFQVSADPDVADPASERELLRFTQPFSNHNGGDLHFGPDDGLLYISSGDGGSSGDPQNNAQNLGNLLGAILRIDVNGDNAPSGQYGIPADNPFLGQAGAREEIYAFGLRNPYRFSIDDGPTGAAADRVFAGDVGQGSFEEIDHITSGGNYGWRIREGAHPFNTGDPDPGNLIDPIAEYPNDSTTDAVIGGYVYRGGQFPALSGLYIFGDLTGKMFVVDDSSGSPVLADLNVVGGNPLNSNIIGFGQDEAGELYVLTFSSLLALEVAAPHPIQVASDLNGVNGFVLNGIAPDDDSGRSVNSAGDVNGDGFEDLVIGADGADPNGALSGETYVVFGKATPFASSFELSSLDGSNGFVLRGISAFDRSGLSVSSAGDVNGDAVDDLVIGALEASGSGDNSGQSYVVFGSTSGFPANLELSALDGTNGFAINGAAESDFSGVSVSAAGDVNGDGFADVMIGAPYADPSGRDKAGQAYVLFGSATGFPATVSLNALDGTGGFAINGAAAGDQAGFAVSSAGDINGDGFADVLVGSYDASPNGAASGASYVVFGQPIFAASVEVATLDGSNGFAIHGQASGDYAGRAVSQAGDVNGDGWDDLLIGAYGQDQSRGASYLVFGKNQPFPAAVELSNLTATEGVEIRGATAGESSGRAVGGLGDVDGDGLDDVVIGALYADPENRDSAGAAYVVFGRADFHSTVELSALDGRHGFAIHGADANDLSGLAVGGGGDINGDGLTEVLVAAPSADPGGNSEEGESYVIFGSDFRGTITHHGDAAENTLAGDSAANTIVAGAGDDVLLGRGGGDLLIGGQGSDALVIADGGFRKLAGGRGEDTVRIEGNGVTIDLTQIPDNRITGIERFDITGNGGNSLVLNVREALNLSPTSNIVVVRADSNDNVNIGSGWEQDGIESLDDEFYDVFRQAAAKVLILISDHPAWQNQAQPFDVDNDTFVAPIDVLLIINELERRAISDPLGQLPVPPSPPNSPPPFYDVDGDDFIAPIDGLLIINFLNLQSGEGEGLAVSLLPPLPTRLPSPPLAGFERTLVWPPAESETAPLPTVVGPAPRDASATSSWWSQERELNVLEDAELDDMFAELADVFASQR